MPEAVRGQQIPKYMEGNYLTAGDLALFGKGYGMDGYHKRDNTGVTGIGLAAGLGGAALLGVLAIGWGLNQASRARTQGNARAIDILANQQLAERNSRETWQNTHAPTLTQYVDVQTGAGAFSGSTSNALATALALQNNSGVNSAIGGCNYLRVARVSGSRLCGCDTCEES